MAFSLQSEQQTWIFRSLETNFEVNAMIYDEEIAKVLTNQFLEDQEKSELVILEEWQKRPRINKIKESFARILAPML